MKIFHKLLLAFFVVVSLIWVAALLSINISEQALQQSIVDDSILLATNILDDIDMLVHKRIEQIEEYQTDIFLRQVVEKSNSEFDRMDNVQDYMNTVDKEWASAPKDKILPIMADLENNSLARELKEKRAFYDERYGYNIYGEMLVTNKYGACVAQTGRTSGYRQDNEIWWKKAREEGVYVSDSEYDDGAGAFGINVGFRIDDEHGDFIGVMKVVLNLEEVLHILESVQTSGLHSKHHATDYTLVNKNHRVIYSTEGFRFLDDISQDLGVGFGSKENNPTKYGGEKFLGKKEEISVFSRSGRYKNNSGLGWHLIVSENTDEIFAPIVTLKHRLISSLLLVTMLAALISLFFSRSLTKHIAELEKDVRSISDGNLDTVIHIGAKDEIGLFASSFRKMAQNLKRMTDELRFKNKELTKTNFLLAESEEMSRAISKTAADPIIVIDHHGKVAEWNHAAERIFGYSENEAVGKELHSLIAPGRYYDDYKRGFESFKESGDGPVINKTMEFAAIRKDGTEFLIEASVSSIFVKGTWHAVGIIRDVSEHRYTEMQLKALTRNLPGIVFRCFLKEKRKMQFFNNMLESLTGYSEGDLSGDSVCSIEPLIVQEDRTQVVLEVENAVKAHRPFEIEYRVKHKDGRIRFFLERGRPVFSPDGEPLYIDGVIFDVSERIQTEKALFHRQTELSVLYKVSSAVSRTIELDKLFDIILKTITDLEVLKVKRRAGIFIVEEDRMELVAHLGHPRVFLDLHKGMKVGTCLCGLAAERGEIVLSKDSTHDDRHSIKYAGMFPHGHIIVPLKVREKVVGVLYLYTKADAPIDENKLNILITIGNQLGIAIDNAKRYEETKAISFRDSLTGLANRRMMGIVLQKNFIQARRFGRPLSIMMIDIDYFKKYNDTYGHPAGDELLRECARLIIRKIRPSDLAVRYGGEEFLVLLPETSLKRATEAAERLRKEAENTLGVTLSIGITSYTKAIENEGSFVKQADDALYQAKQKGRNRIEIAPSALPC